MTILTCKECSGKVSSSALHCPHCGHINSPAFDGTQLYDLSKAKAAQDIQEQLLAAFKKKAWVAALIIAIVGITGINALVTLSVYGFLQDDLAIATRAATIANESAKESKSAVSKSKDILDTLDQQSKTVENSFEALKVRMDSENANTKNLVDLQITGITDRLGELEELMEKLVVNFNDKNKSRIVQEYADTVASMKDEKNKDRAVFEENSNYYVHITSGESASNDAVNIRNSLASIGFKTGIFETSLQEVDKAMVIYPQQPATKEKASEVRDRVEHLIGAPVTLWQSPVSGISVPSMQIRVILPNKLKRTQANGQDEIVLAPRWIERNMPVRISKGNVYLTVMNVGEIFKGVYFSLIAEGENIIEKKTLRPGKAIDFSYNNTDYLLKIHESDAEKPEKAKISISKKIK